MVLAGLCGGGSLFSLSLARIYTRMQLCWGRTTECNKRIKASVAIARGLWREEEDGINGSLPPGQVYASVGISVEVSFGRILYLVRRIVLVFL